FKRMREVVDGGIDTGCTGVDRSPAIVGPRREFIAISRCGHRDDIRERVTCRIKRPDIVVIALVSGSADEEQAGRLLYLRPLEGIWSIFSKRTDHDPGTILPGIPDGLHDVPRGEAPGLIPHFEGHDP